MTYCAAVIRLTDGTPNVPWAVTTSVNLAHRGLDIEPADVDVMTTANGTDLLEDVFSAGVIRSVRQLKETGGERTRSDFDARELAGTEVERMEDIKHRVDGAWRYVANVAETRESLSVEGRKIPAISLAYELRGYRALGCEERVCPPKRSRVET